MTVPDLVSMKFCCLVNLYPIEGTMWLTAFDDFFATTGSQLSQVALPVPMEDKNSAYDLI